MADPSPPVLLPACEYLELHNRTPNDILLVGWKLQIGNTVKTLPSIDLDSAGYAVIIAQKYQEAFTPFANNIYTLSSLSLTDAGQKLILYDNEDQVIHTVSYKKEWHSETIKQDGGWSLEMKDENIPDVGKENWDSSSDETGGTPGRQNSICQHVGDFSAPEIERITLRDAHTIRLFFTESIFFPSIISNDILEITPTIPIVSIKDVAPNFRALDIFLADSLQTGRIYTISVVKEIPDFTGNICRIGENIRFGKPIRPAPGSLAINEVLSQPFSGTDADFIEIYNKSKHIIDLKDVKIGSGGDTIPQKAVGICDGLQLLPGDYCAVCKNKQLTEQQYVCTNSRALLQCDSLPNYANASGVVFLSTIDLKTIDRFSYDEDMHFSELSSTEGVSLERLDYNMPTQDKYNWHSAASTVGYATPGFVNSHARTTRILDSIMVSPEVFSPNNDGFEDYTIFNIAFKDNDNRLNINIFNQRGQLICHLVNNAICGKESQFRWDGIDDCGTLLPSGMYVAKIQWWNLSSGKSHTMKKVVSIWL